jgi:hypothetical protein
VEKSSLAGTTFCVEMQKKPFYMDWYSIGSSKARLQQHILMAGTLCSVDMKEHFLGTPCCIEMREQPFYMGWYSIDCIKVTVILLHVLVLKCGKASNNCQGTCGKVLKNSFQLVLLKTWQSVK